MKVQRCHSLLQATCCLLIPLLISIAATYATSPPQAEVSDSQTIAPRAGKFGEKIVQNEIFLPTPITPLKTVDRGTTTLRQDRDESKRESTSPVRVTHSTEVNTQMPRRSSAQLNPQPQTSPRIDYFLPTPLTQSKQEYITLPTHAPPSENTVSHLSQRHNAASSDHNLVQQYDIPAVHKTHQVKPQKPITPAGVGQQQATSSLPPPSQATNSNRSRISHTKKENNAQAPSSSQATAGERQRQQQQQQRQTTAAVATTRRIEASRTNSQHSTLQSPPTPASRIANRNSSARSRSIANKPTRNHQQNSLPRPSVTAPGQYSPMKMVPLPPSASGQQIRPKSTSVNQHSNRTNSRKSSKSVATTTTPRPLFSLPNEYNIFSPAFWSFLNPTFRNRTPPEPKTTTTPVITTTKKPPKKYNPTQQVTLRKEEKLTYSKTKPTQNPTTTTTTTTTTSTTPIPEPIYATPPKRKDEGPFRIALPTFNILNSRRETSSPAEKDKRDAEDDNDPDLRAKYNCPRESEVRFQLFPKICTIDEDCKVWNRGEICCDIFGAKSCVSGIPKPLEETSHSPILGLIPRKCPGRPLAELWWEVKECETDMDCWPRVCCPDGRRRYCRTSQPELDTIPVPVQRSFNYLTEYLECTAPPPPIFDLHPKTCSSTLDCFPNVCCQEAGLRHCRPPKKSVLTMLANVFNVDLVKRLTQNIVIK
uniref:WAP domain-containing protein n=2 Tax=Stomoxys calcitrans TaxID=35570 RepID=A0A1I8P6T4_STOCA